LNFLATALLQMAIFAASVYMRCVYAKETSQCEKSPTKETSKYEKRPTKEGCYVLKGLTLAI